MSNTEPVPPASPEDELTTRQGAVYLGVSRKLLLYWAREAPDVLPHGGTPGKWTFKRRDLDQFRDNPPETRRNRKGPPLPALITEAAVVLVLVLGVGWREAPACEWCHRVMHPDIYGAAYARVRIG